MGGYGIGMKKHKFWNHVFFLFFLCIKRMLKIYLFL